MFIGRSREHTAYSPISANISREHVRVRPRTSAYMSAYVHVALRLQQCGSEPTRQPTVVNASAVCTVIQVNIFDNCVSIFCLEHLLKLQYNSDWSILKMFCSKHLLGCYCHRDYVCCLLLFLFHVNFGLAGIFMHHHQHCKACLHFVASKCLLAKVCLPYESNQLT